MLKRRVARLALGAAAAYVALCGLAAASYRSLLFPAPRLAIEPSLSGAELLRLPSEHGEVVALHKVARPGEPTVVFFHGNGEDLADSVALGRALSDLGLGFYAIEYPGYGLAKAQAPSEDAIYAAAEVGLAELARRGAPRERVVLVGMSLGSGVATELASRGRGAGLVVLAPFTSIPDVARRIAPFLPVATIVRDRFDSLAKAPRVTVPALVVHGDRDNVVPVDMGRTLADALPRAELHVIEGAGHNDLFARDPELVRRIAAFARAAAAAPPPAP